MPIKAKLDLVKFARDIKRATGEAAETVAKSLTTSDLQEIGDACVDEMKAAIAKGISPIEGEGRFGAYKWASLKTEAKKIAKQYSDKKKRRIASKKIESDISNKYPFSQKKNFPNKRERPVNLFLSGDFLSHLKAQVSSRRIINIGFFDELSAKKEQGHREGVNGQPMRPVIPGKDEELSSSIYRRIVKTLDQILKKRKFKT